MWRPSLSSGLLIGQNEDLYTCDFNMETFHSKFQRISFQRALKGETSAAASDEKKAVNPTARCCFCFRFFYRVACTASAVMRAEGVKQQLRSQVCGGELLDRAVGCWVARLTWGLHETSYLCLQVWSLPVYLFLLKYFKINSWRNTIFIPAQKETNVQLQ